MKFSEVASRLTGFSTPLFGVSWTPPQADRAVVRQIVVFLEDRRVLYDPYEAERPEWAVQSVLEIRGFLTDQLVTGGLTDELATHVMAMRAACRRFLDTRNPAGFPAIPDVESAAPEEGPAQRQRLRAQSHDVYGGLGPANTWVFNQALGEWRATMGIHLAQLAAKYGVDIPDHLAAVIPLEPD